VSAGRKGSRRASREEGVCRNVTDRGSSAMGSERGVSWERIAEWSNPYRHRSTAAMKNEYPIGT